MGREAPPNGGVNADRLSADYLSVAIARWTIELVVRWSTECDDSSTKTHRERSLLEERILDIRRREFSR